MCFEQDESGKSVLDFPQGAKRGRPKRELSFPMLLAGDNEGYIGLTHLICSVHLQSTSSITSPVSQVKAAEPVKRKAPLAPVTERSFTTSDSAAGTITVLGQDYPRDDYTNIPSSILDRLAATPVLTSTPSHPLHLLTRQIRRHLAGFQYIYPPPAPVVSAELNFGDLGFPADHPGRSPTDTYYVNRDTCLRTHTSAHEVQTFEQGHDAWLLCADVYRRDEIDASHYPIFHQMEGARMFDPTKGDYEARGAVERECEAMEAELRKAAIEISDEVDVQEAGGWQEGMNAEHAALAMRHLKATLNGLVLELFGPRHALEAAAAAEAPEQQPAGKGKSKGAHKAERNGGDGINSSTMSGVSESAIDPLKVRWVSATFPFTSPSFEVEVWFRGKWLEILGCGVVKQRTLDKAGVPHKLGWAFGLGIERIAMVLYSIPDIRLFWSRDPRFLSQFALAESGMLDDQAGQMGDQRLSAAGGNGSAPKDAAERDARSAQLVTFRPYSRFPACYKDTSFWLAAAQQKEQGGAAQQRGFHENDLMEIVRDEAGDLVEDVKCIDDFTHPKTQRRSLCYRVNYRSMDRNLENEEVNALHHKVVERLVSELGIEPR